MIILDIETTGEDPSIHGIIDVAAIEFENPRNRFHAECRLEPGVIIDDKALAYNGFVKADLYSLTKEPLETALKRFSKWSHTIKDRTIAGHNPSFDTSFLSRAYRTFEMHWDFGYRTIDQHSIAYEFAERLGYTIPYTTDKTSALGSDQIMKFVGIPSEPKPHNSAMNGVIWETEAFHRLKYGKNLLPQFTEFEVPEYLVRYHAYFVQK